MAFKRRKKVIAVEEGTKNEAKSDNFSSDQNDSSTSSFPLLSEVGEVGALQKHEQEDEELHNLTSILSKTNTKFMSSTERDRAMKRSKKRSSGARQKVHFDDLSRYIELETIDSTFRDAEEAVNIFIRLGFPTIDVFNRNVDLPFRRLSQEVPARKFWAKMKNLLPFQEEEERQITDEEIPLTPRNTRENFNQMVSILCRNWEFGGALDDEEIDELPGGALFPNGEREKTEEENFEIFEDILDMMPIDEFGWKVDRQILADIFTNYVSLQFVVSTIHEGNFKAKATQILAHKIVHPKSEFHDWSASELGVRRLLQLFEREVETFKSVENNDLFNLGPCPDQIIKHLNRRVLLPLETPQEEPKFMGATGVVLRSKSTHGEQFLDLITQNSLKLVRRSVAHDFVDEDSEFEGNEELFLDVENDVFLSNPTPIVVPITWTEKVHLLDFLKSPWNCWITSKMIFLRSYFDFLNQIMVQACLNSNMKLLQLIRKHQIPQSFKSKIIACCSFAENSKLGTVQLAIKRKLNKKQLQHLGNNKIDEKYLAANSSSYFLNPLVRADLYFSFTQHCMFTSPCTGHSGLLLVYMIRMNNYDFVKVLIEDGVRVNSKICMLPAQSYSWQKEQLVVPSGSFNLRKGIFSSFEKKKKLRKETELFISIASDIKLEEKLSLKEEIKKYVENTGLVNDRFFKEVAKSSKVTPINIALELILRETSDETSFKILDLILENNASFFKANASGFTETLRGLSKIADINLNIYHKKYKDISSSAYIKRFSFLRPKNNKNNKQKTRESGGSGSTFQSKFNKIKTLRKGGRKEKDEDTKLSENLLNLMVLKGTCEEMKKLSELDKKRIQYILGAIERGKEELREKYLNSKLNHSKEFLNYKLNLSLRIIWLHHALINEEWKIAKFLTLSYSFASTKQRQKLKQKKRIVASEKDNLEDNIICSTIDMLLYSLSQGRYPFVAQALNGIYFLLSECNIMLSLQQYQTFLSILGDGLLRLPYPRAGTIEPLKKIFSTRQFKYLFKLSRSTSFTTAETKDINISDTNNEATKELEEFSFITLKDSWDEEEFESPGIQNKLESFRKGICLRLLSSNLYNLGQNLIKSSDFKDIDFLKDIILLCSLSNYSTYSLDKVLNIFKTQSLDIKDEIKGHIKYMLINSINEIGVSRIFIENGYLNDDNIIDFTQHFLSLPKLASPRGATQGRKSNHKEARLLNNDNGINQEYSQEPLGSIKDNCGIHFLTLLHSEVVYDFSYIFILFAINEYFKLIDDFSRRQKLYEALFERLKPIKNIWIEGLHYLFEFGKFQANNLMPKRGQLLLEDSNGEEKVENKEWSELKTEMEKFSDRFSKYKINYNVITQYVGFTIKNNRRKVFHAKKYDTSNDGSESEMSEMI